MEKLYTGKTKDVYKIDENSNRLYFKDDVTGTDGKFDPGADTVGLTVDGSGYYGLAMSKFFFELLRDKRIKTHYIDASLEDNTMDVEAVTFFGKGIEVICRYVATGSFIRRYGAYMNDGDLLDSFVEVSLKDDQRGDPFISEQLLELFGILSKEEYTAIKKQTIVICEMIKAELAKKEIELYDIKLEFGKNKAGEVVLIDEISGGNMRVFKNGKSLEPIELVKIITE